MNENFELITMPYACFSVQLETITFDTIQKVLEQAYTQMRANPAYLFCNEEDRKLFVVPPQYTYDIYAIEAQKIGEVQDIAQLGNLITGQLMHIVVLPDLE